MLNFNNIRSFAAAVTVAAGLLVSCVGLETHDKDAVGYLAPPSLEVDVTVDDLLLTKALDFAVVQPSESDIRFVVKDKDGNVKYEGNGLWSEPLVLPVGSYTIEATAGSNTYGAPYFTGTASGRVEALDREVPQLELALYNSLLRVTVSDELKTHFTPAATVVLGNGAHTATYGEWFYVPSGSDITVSLSGNSSTAEPATFIDTLSSPSPKVAYDLVCGKAGSNWPTITMGDHYGAFEGRLYFKAASATNVSEANAAKLSYQIKGGAYTDWQNIADVQALTLSSFTKDSQDYLCLKGLDNGASYSIRPVIGTVVGEDMSFTYNPVSLASCVTASATAAHTTNDAGELNGTRVTSNYTVSGIPTLAAELITLTASGSTKSGETVMSSHSIDLNESGDTKSVDHTHKNGWPYIPKGTYANASTVTCTFPEGGTATVSASITVPAPTFTVTLLNGSYTSYDKYAATNGITKNITEANNWNAETLYYKPGASWTISEDLMKNANYSKTLTFYLDGESKNTVDTYDSKSFVETEENIGGLSWGEHTIMASMTFDNTSFSDTHTHHITGLPYTAAPPKNTGDYPWRKLQGGTVNYIEWNDGSVLLRSDGTDPIVGSYPFHIPGNIDFSLTSVYNKNGANAIKYQFEVQLLSGNNRGNTICEIDVAPKGQHTVSGNSTFTTEYNAVSCRFESQGLWGTYAYLLSVVIQYR